MNRHMASLCPIPSPCSATTRPAAKDTTRVHHDEAGDTETQKRFRNHLRCSTKQSVDMETQKMLETRTDTRHTEGRCGDLEEVRHYRGCTTEEVLRHKTPQRLEIRHSRKMEEEGKQ